MSEHKADQVIKDIRIEARVRLEGHEIELRNLAAVEAGAALRKMKAEEKDRAKRARKAIAEKDALVAKLEETVLTGSEMGMVDGFERWDYDRWEVDTVRKDTGEVVNVRPMTVEEREAYRRPELPYPEQPLDLDLPPQATNGSVHTDANKPSGKARKRHSAAKEVV